MAPKDPWRLEAGHSHTSNILCKSLLLRFYRVLADKYYYRNGPILYARRSCGLPAYHMDYHRGGRGVQPLLQRLGDHTPSIDPCRPAVCLVLLAVWVDCSSGAGSVGRSVWDRAGWGGSCWQERQIGAGWLYGRGGGVR